MKPKIIWSVLPERHGVPVAEVLFDMMAIAQQGLPFIELEPNRTDVARNILAKHLLDSDYTHLLMLDCDHRHPRNIIDRLGKWVEEDPTRQIVAGLAFRRKEPFEPMAYTLTEDGRHFQTIEQIGVGLVEVEMVATCAILIAREVFERLPWPWFAYEYHNGHDPTEDMYFCRKAREAGIQIWVDTNTVSPHLRTAWVDENTYMSYTKLMEGKHARSESA